RCSDVAMPACASNNRAANACVRQVAPGTTRATRCTASRIRSRENLLTRARGIATSNSADARRSGNTVSATRAAITTHNAAAYSARSPLVLCQVLRSIDFDQSVLGELVQQCENVLFG